MAYLTRAEIARQAANTESTNSQRTLAWSRWLEFQESIELFDDPYLDEFNMFQRHKLLGAFAQAMREATFSGDAFDQLVESTIRGTVDSVAQTFRLNDRDDPRHDSGGRLAYILQRQYRGYKNQDRSVKQQKAITGELLLELSKTRSTVTDIAVGQLTMGAFFCTMRSCEYTKTSRSEDKRTKILCLRNLRFLRGHRELSHDDPNLALADTLTITFEYQKNDERDDSVTHHRTGDTIFCPI